MPDDRLAGRAAVSNRMATAQIAWMSFTNRDIGSDKRDEGWYVTVDLADGSSRPIGPDPTTGPGCKTVDEALAVVAKWATDRGMESHRPIIDVAVTRDGPAHSDRAHSAAPDSHSDSALRPEATT